MSQSTSVPSLVSSITSTWHPHLVAAINDHHVKVAKIDGEFIWHAHPNSDELFYLLAGEMDMEIEGQETVRMKEGDVFVVPKGVRHRPIGKNATIMMVEKEGTVNTGDEVGSERTVEVVDGRGRGGDEA
ncbi:RmlC-like cupin [Phaeosphaeriaceae sp. SRC1lsM3a]|nr:RmlC-like cupin [Stagonospora sp. SRC1lsM3a]